jgi:hypothetical protein
MTKIGQKLTSRQRKVFEGEFAPIVRQICREGGPIDQFAETCSWGDLSQNYYNLPQIHRNQVFNNSVPQDDDRFSVSKEHWLTNLQNVLPEYGLDPVEAGLGLDPYNVG